MTETSIENIRRNKKSNQQNYTHKHSVALSSLAYRTSQSPSTKYRSVLIIKSITKRTDPRSSRKFDVGVR
jgi:hypothetical protein